MRATDRALGILFGILLGLAIVTAFVFLGSGETIDSPGIEGNGSGTATERTVPAEP